MTTPKNGVMASDVCKHGIHKDNACGACIPPRGTTAGVGRWIVADVNLPPLPQPKVRRHLVECAVFDPSPGPCDCGSPPKVYDALEMASYARRAVEADRATRGVAPSPAPLNGIPATWSHDEGAYAQCGDCGRYSADPDSLRRHSFGCECGSVTGWSGSFKKPGPNAKWSGAAPGVGVPHHQSVCTDTLMPKKDEQK